MSSNSLVVASNPAVDTKFEKYPEDVKAKMDQLRELIITVANETHGVEDLEETLKWGEPAYLTKHGSTLRIDWKTKNPNQYALYFQCTSQLVPTFRFVFGDTLSFEGNRAIILPLDNDPPVDILKQCIATALTYHKVKKLPTLGL
ncbi:DUF1801 domain-containing protein [Roseivirga misakiensis]|uniref:YdhG-like domain-containing protein n=1 Tax=Roseivirga misakiensis TaxID=1563681 RepID=A0A1E5SL48_9BACT|nr:DUF1801 domain-containing protein [Roseivirga misakiensis]OEJ99849.1 hypothetical protein BFP71_09880 [Roseivirga misakiensis]